MSSKNNINPELIKHIYSLSYNYAAILIGQEKTKEMLTSSYRKILHYFQNLSIYEMNDNNDLRIHKSEISEKEFLGFTIWIQQFVKDFKEFMVGLKNLDIETITREIKDQLNEIGFYEYYNQAMELEY